MKYRSDALFSDGYRKADKVMAYESFELLNTDILDTLADTILKGTSIEKELRILSFEVSNDEPHVDDTDERLYDMIDEYAWNEEIGIEYFNKVLKAVSDVVGKDIKYCLWLCDTREDVKKEYDHRNELDLSDINSYEESDVILSDLGAGGKLYGYEEEPKEVEEV